MKNINNNYLEIYMSWIVILGQSMHFIQAGKIFYNKSATGVSLISHCICFFLLIHWLGYGLLTKNRVLIMAEGFGIVGVILVISGILIYG